MNIRNFLKLAVVACSAFTIFGCGGGGGGEPSTGAPGGPGGPTTPATPVAALTLSTQGTLPASTTIGGIDVTVNLPAGVTAKADADGTTQNGVCAASGAAVDGTPVAKFTAATASTPAQLRIAVIKASGFNVGEFVTANLDFSGTAPAASGFTVSGTPIMSDLNGNPITGLTIVPAVQIK